MSTDDLNIYVAAREIEDPKQLNEFLETACYGDTALENRIRDLLSAEPAADLLVDSPARLISQLLKSDQRTVSEPLDSDFTGDPTSETLVGCSLGPYAIHDVIGEGGMGFVYRATQEQPIKRDVAIKLLRPGLCSRNLLSRFELERQALARMEHPNIARVFDAGIIGDDRSPLIASTSKKALLSGQPYFVMELVHGIPITDYCDAARYPIRDRLELLIPVCEAVQHAHQKAIIHRDLKPSNILITEIDGRAEPRVIDFGVAKGVSETFSDSSLHTGAGTLIGTLAYMSPEQAGLNSLDVDTRSDVYSLGVLIYEILAGDGPIGRETVDQTPPMEVLRMIRERDPPPPSQRFATSNSHRDSVAASRSTDVLSLSKQLRGELDWIAVKALEKDPERRYQSAAALADDIRRYLNNEPLEAGPPAVSYRCKKFVRRNRVLVGAASILAATLLMGILGTTWGLLSASRAWRAEMTERQQAEEIADALRGLFEGLDPQVENEDLATQLTSRLNLFVKRLDEGSELNAKTESSLRHTIGMTLLGLGEYKRAESLFRQAIELQNQQTENDDVAILASQNALGYALHKQKKYEESLELLHKAWKGREFVLGPTHADTLRSKMNVGMSLMMQNQKQKANLIFEEILDANRQGLISHELDFEAMQGYLSNVYLHQGRRDEALQLLEQIHRSRTERLGEDHPRTLMAINSLAMFYRWTDDDAGSLPFFERLYAGRKRQLGMEHPDTQSATVQLAYAYRALKRHAEEEPLWQSVVERCRQSPNADADKLADRLALLGECQLNLMQYGAAESSWREAQKLMERNQLGTLRDFKARKMLGLSLARQAKFQDAEALFTSTHNTLQSGVHSLREAECNVLKAEIADHIVEMYEAWGQPENAERWRQSSDVRESVQD